MDIDRVLALFDAEVRAQPQAQPGMAIERVGGVVRITGPFNFICAWDLTSEAAGPAVANQAAHFRARGETLLWRVYDHDRPAELSACLTKAGFVANEANTLMTLDLSEPLEALFAATSAEVRRVATLAELDGFVRSAGLAFGEEESWRREAYADRLADPDLGLYVAYVDGQAAASARIEMSDAWSFGLLQGGGTTPEHRRRGLYRALTAARAEAARARGLAYLVVDARETSRPILEGLGFAPAARAALWRLDPRGEPVA
jgi:ribosomal protein S18 acetylase RimI-like enzyme